jgi:hypothetical protein
MSSDNESKVKTRPADKSPVRQRVARHLKRLLIPGVMGLGACKGTESTPVVCDPMPAPQDAGAGPADDTSTAVPTATPDASPPPVVCDPMPAPMPTPKKK